MDASPRLADKSSTRIDLLSSEIASSSTSLYVAIRKEQVGIEAYDNRLSDWLTIPTFKFVLTLTVLPH